ncbi:MAG: aspartate ammonia-lyase [Myxococcales bacterium]|nr:MAG: aspartate ammonia-lyase [Myxococcales bacterium]
MTTTAAGPGRIEHDLIGDIAVPAEALYGAHARRALLNFPSTGRPWPPRLARAFALVKKAALAVNLELGFVPKEDADAIGLACDELAEGALDRHLVVDPLSGGAGTSLNMNVNEVLANRANQILGQPLGLYRPIHPNDTVNRGQSTNDVFPTAVRVAALWALNELEMRLAALQAAFQEKERQFADVTMVGRTELQDAVPMTAGQLVASWAEAVARDRWRVFKCAERLKVVNLGGTAIGTGIGAPRRFIFRAVEALRQLTGLPLARAENLVEATSNQDALVEADGILEAAAANLLKIANDLRLLSMSPIGELTLPPMQAGSSIMPGKVNPVIPEYVAQLALETMAGHQALVAAVSQGNLQLSQYFPLAAWHLLDNLRLLDNAARALVERLLPDLAVDAARCREHLSRSLSVAAVFVPKIGYEKAQEAVALAGREGLTLSEALARFGVSEAEIAEALSPARLRRLGE